MPRWPAPPTSSHCSRSSTCPGPTVGRRRPVGERPRSNLPGSPPSSGGRTVSSPRSGPARLAEVADRAGISLATASRVLNGSDRTVGDRLQGRVLAAAAQLGYRANPHAQAIARGASNVVGLVVHDLADPYFYTIADGVMRQCEHQGLVVVLASTPR